MDANGQLPSIIDAISMTTLKGRDTFPFFIISSSWVSLEKINIDSISLRVITPGGHEEHFPITTNEKKIDEGINAFAFEAHDIPAPHAGAYIFSVVINAGEQQYNSLPFCLAVTIAPSEKKTKRQKKRAS